MHPTAGLPQPRRMFGVEKARTPQEWIFSGCKYESVPDSANHGTLLRNAWVRLAALFSEHGPNYAQSPSDGPFRSTTDDNDSNNSRVRHSDPVAGFPPRGCALPCHGSLCPVWLRLFRWRVGISIDHRHGREAPLQITKATTP